jgi:pyruvate-formate lyase-activating enzyme
MSILHNVGCGNCKELVLRYCNCQLKCVYCFAISYAWQSNWINERVKTIKQAFSLKNFDWIRISGGEPLLNKKHTRELIETFLLLDRSVDEPLRVIIQTNGFALSKKEIQTELKRILSIENLQILIELSLKGTNSREFSLLTQRKGDLYSRQIKGYEFLQEITSKNGISVRARMGIGPHSKSIIFVYPDTFPKKGEIGKSIEAMFHPSKWSYDFNMIFKSEIHSYGYMAIEDINVTEGGINARINLNIPAIVRLLERKLILDRANVVNTYSDFASRASTSFPWLTNGQKVDLETQYREIRSKFSIVPADAYLGKKEFTSRRAN